jgi:uncharacterized membrane protein
MREEKTTAHRLAAYSDAVFAVIVTTMVLELKAPDRPAFSALWPLWPTAVSYAVSYLFIAIIWINHHHLWRFVGPPTLGLIWINFVHLFMVSLLPFATAWVARVLFVLSERPTPPSLATESSLPQVVDRKRTRPLKRKYKECCKVQKIEFIAHRTELCA